MVRARHFRMGRPRGGRPPPVTVRTSTAREPIAVAVIGGGVAGAAACLSLSRKGLRPVWIAPVPDDQREPVGETLAPAARPILAALGASEVVAPGRHRAANATFSAWGSSHLSERNAAIHLEGPGLVLDRRAFERDLAGLAGAVAIRAEASLRAAVSADGAWRLDLDDGSRVAARFAIDATGRAACLARRHARYRRADQLVAAVAFLPHRDPSVEPTRATLIEAAPDGWFYASLLPDGRLSVAYFSDPDLAPPGVSRDAGAWRALLASAEHVGRWIADAGFAVEEPARLWSAGATRLDPPAGETSDGAGWAAVGDAAAAFDPLSSHGITTALWTGERAGSAAAAWLAGDTAPLADYARAVADGAERFIAARRAVYSRERRWTTRPFWARRAGEGSAYAG